MSIKKRLEKLASLPGADGKCPHTGEVRFYSNESDKDTNPRSICASCDIEREVSNVIFLPFNGRD